MLLIFVRKALRVKFSLLIGSSVAVSLCAFLFLICKQLKYLLKFFNYSLTFKINVRLNCEIFNSSDVLNISTHNSAMLVSKGYKAFELFKFNMCLWGMTYHNKTKRIRTKSPPNENTPMKYIFHGFILLWDLEWDLWCLFICLSVFFSLRNWGSLMNDTSSMSSSLSSSLFSGPPMSSFLSLPVWSSLLSGCFLSSVTNCRWIIIKILCRRPFSVMQMCDCVPYFQIHIFPDEIYE